MDPKRRRIQVSLAELEKMLTHQEHWDFWDCLDCGEACEDFRLWLVPRTAEPNPATHAILILLKAGGSQLRLASKYGPFYFER